MVGSFGWRWRRPVRVVNLQFSVAALGAAIGALMLVAPHQFSAAVYGPLEPQLVWWGSGFLVTSAGVLWAVVFALPRTLHIAVHLVSGAFLLALGGSFAQAGGWSGLAAFFSLGVAIALAAFLPPVPLGPPLPLVGSGDTGSRAVRLGTQAPCDLLAIAVGCVASLIGVSMLIVRAQGSVNGYESIRHQLSWFALAFLAAGVLQLFAQLRSNVPRVVTTAAHLLIAGVFVLYVAVSALPQRAWSGVLLYGGLAVMVPLLPWLAPRVQQLSARSLRARLALALCAAAALPLTLAVSLDAHQDQESVSAAIFALHEAAAVGVAQDVALTVSAFQRAATSIAAVPGLLAQPPEAQTALLRSLSLTPRPRNIATFDAAGVALARSDTRPLSDATGSSLLTDARRTGAPSAGIIPGSEPGQPIFGIAAPVLDAQGQFAGLLQIELEHFLDLLTTVDVGAGSRVYLLDAQGGIVAYPTIHLANGFANLSGAAPISQELMASPDASAPSGSLVYRAHGQRWLAGYGRVAGTGIGWTVVVERSEGAALAALRTSQERAYGLLVLAVVLAVAGGVFVAGRLAAPLKTLANAVERLGAGESAAPLPQSDITEVALLAGNFAQMRDQLAARAAERERLAERLGLLLQTATTLSEATKIGAALEEVLDRVIEAVPVVDASAVYAYDAELELLLPMACSGLLREPFSQIRLQSGEGPAGHVFATGQPFPFDSDTLAPVLATLSPPNALLIRHLDQTALRSGVILPLRTQSGVLIGTAMFGSRHADITVEDESLLEGIAVQIAIAVRNGQLYGRAQRQSHDLQVAMAELQEAEQQMVQQERLRALGQMASGIAHDVNNALAPVVGFSELLLLHPEDLQDLPKARRLLGLIHTGASDASSVVARLREFSRPREQHEVFRAVDLAHLIEQVVSLTQPKWKDQAQALGRTVLMETDITPLPPVAGNEAALREGLTNLILNAVDAMPDGGAVTLVARRDGQEALVEVRDTGLGMTEEVRLRCLEPFFTTKEARGTGLGLAMVHGIVRRHGGTLEIESAVGKGTTFRIRLPLASATTLPVGPDAGAPGPGEPPRQSLRVLVVDDDSGVRAVTAALLEAIGHIPHQVEGGRQALAALGAGEWDLVVTDRAMPDMSGDQLAVAVKHTRPDLPVLLLTGFGDMMNAAGELPDGVDRVVGKPLTAARLRAAVAAVIDAV